MIDYAETYLLYLEKERAKLLEIEKDGKKLTKSQKANLDNINKEIAELTQPDNKKEEATQGKGSVLGEYSFTLQKKRLYKNTIKI